MIDLLDPVVALAAEAGRAIVEVYERDDHGVSHKDDASPLTEADLASHRIIVEGLRALTPAVPVLSEESAGTPWAERQSWSRYWLVDPLDGTKEFIKRNGEFTVNIALIEQGQPVLGVVYVPVAGHAYLGLANSGAWKQERGARSAIRTAPIKGGRPLRVVASRTHRGADLDAWLDNLRAHFPVLDFVSMGSSLKICLIAEGRADIYPRLAPTCEWDTAAAQAILEAAGGRIVDLSGRALTCNRSADYLNPHFVALGDAAFTF
jgi:3'(2'), 5'-bisphosphate nucleotidase